MSVILLAWAVMFVIFARNAPHAARPKSLSEMLSVLAREPLAWALAAFYFLTFGGFVAFSIYLPTLLRDQFGLRPADAGFRTAGFVVLATLCRPLGGWLSDRIGGSRVLSWILPAIATFGLLLGVQSMLPFTVGALGCAALLGIRSDGCLIELEAHEFFRGFCRPLLPLGCCWACNRCCHLRLEHLDALPCSASATEQYFNLYHDIFRPREPL